MYSLTYASRHAALVCLASCKAYKNKQKHRRMYSNIPDHIDTYSNKPKDQQTLKKIHPIHHKYTPNT